MRLTGLAAAVLLAFAGNAIAQSTAAGPSAKPAAKTAGKGTAARISPSTQVAPGLTIARDADTGALRAPTESEAAALAAPAPSAPAEIIQFVTPSGSIAAQVPEDFLTYTVVSKNADGSLSSICMPDKQSAEAAVRRSAAAPAQTAVRSRTPLRPAEGAPHE
jgi:hypothetical protein